MTPKKSKRRSSLEETIRKAAEEVSKWPPEKLALLEAILRARLEPIEDYCPADRRRFSGGW